MQCHCVGHTCAPVHHCFLSSFYTQLDRVLSNCAWLDQVLSNCARLDRVLSNCAWFDQVLSNCAQLDRVLSNCARLDRVLSNCARLDQFFLIVHGLIEFFLIVHSLIEFFLIVHSLIEFFPFTHSLIEFFRKIKKWSEMAKLSSTFIDKVETLERKFEVASIIFDKYKKEFCDIFLCPEERQTPGGARQCGRKSNKYASIV